MTRSSVSVVLLVLGAAFAGGVPAARVASGDGETARPRFNLTPSYHIGDRFRVVRDYRQRTVTAQPSTVRRPINAMDPSSYDATVHVDATVTVESVTPAGDPEVWTARFDQFRYDLPDPLQNAEYRLRRRERKAKNLPEDSHPLEGEIVKVDQAGPKTKVYRETESGKDYAITQRYPEVLPLMQELVTPDWTPVDSIPLGGEWDMNADHVFRFTRVLMRTPLKGVIRCRLASVISDVATIQFTARLKNSWANIDMRLDVHGTIVFDLGRRRPGQTAYEGEVQISSPGSSTTGLGRIEGGTAFLPVAPADAATTPASAPAK
jgi:hypothetical protein